jgi:hypothetical protein
MKHSFFSNFKKTDLIRFDNNQILEINKLKKALKTIFEDRLESPLVNALALLGIKTYTGTRIKSPSGKEKTVYNSWFKEGVHCEVLTLGNEKWKRGKIKIEISIEFEEDNILEDDDKDDDQITYSKTVKPFILEDIIDVDDELELLKKQMQEGPLKSNVETEGIIDLELEDLRKKLNDL